MVKCKAQCWPIAAAAFVTADACCPSLLCSSPLLPADAGFRHALPVLAQANVYHPSLILFVFQVWLSQVTDAADASASPAVAVMHLRKSCPFLQA